MVQLGKVTQGGGCGCGCLAPRPSPCLPGPPQPPSAARGAGPCPEPPAQGGGRCRPPLLAPWLLHPQADLSHFARTCLARVSETHSRYLYLPSMRDSHPPAACMEQLACSARPGHCPLLPSCTPLHSGNDLERSHARQGKGRLDLPSCPLPKASLACGEKGGKPSEVMRSPAEGTAVRTCVTLRTSSPPSSGNL